MWSPALALKKKKKSQLHYTRLRQMALSRALFSNHITLFLTWSLQSSIRPHKYRSTNRNEDDNLILICRVERKLRAIYLHSLRGKRRFKE